MMQGPVIGIDPATKCGWAILASDGTRIASGVWKLERRKNDGAGMTYVRFEQNFRELLTTYQPRMVAFEHQINHRPGGAQIGAGIISHLQRICEELAVPYTGVAAATIKKHATGKGNASKELVLHEAAIRWPPNGIGMTDDEADALWCADAAREGLA